MSDISASESPVFVLARRLGLSLPGIAAAWANASDAKRELASRIEDSQILSGGADSDRSFVVFGSLARNEFTGSGRSDVDWTLLVDGVAAVQDIDLVHRLRHLVNETGHKEPNAAGPFGNLAFSHDLIHQIGGSDDSNVNTTQRLLLLLESVSLYGEQVRTRVVRNILSRYVLEDESFLSGKHEEHVPRFLLNDVARFWRTMAVDFQTKKRERENKGFALRNVKLRFSRKLLYLAGLVTCFSFCIWQDDADVKRAWDSGLGLLDRGMPIVFCLEKFANMPPLELLSLAFLNLGMDAEPVKQFLSSYDGFLQLLSDENSRRRLEELAPENMAEDEVYQGARNLSHMFQKAIEDVFLAPRLNLLSELTIKYGVF